MKHYVYAYFKKKGGFYTQPILNPYDKELIVELTHRTFLSNVGTPEHQEQAECELYYFGLFDDVSGKFDLLDHPEFLTSFVDVPDVQKEVIEDGGKENSQSIQKS